MGKVLVKAIEPNYNTLSGGPPVMMVGSGRRRRGGDEPVGRTLRERAGGAAGGLVGVLGALAGQHRSLGGLAQSMISGGAQGKALGGALGRKFVGRTGQRRADLREGRRQQRAQSDAEMAEDQRRRGVGVLSRFNPAAKFRRDNQEIRDREDQLLDRTNLNNRSRTQAQQQVGVYGAGRIADARNQAQRAANAEETARRKAQGTQFGEEDRQYAEQYRNLRESLVAMGVPEQEVEQRMNAFNQQAKSQGYRVDPQPTSNDPTQGGTVAVQADGTPLGNVQDVVNQTLALPAPAGGAGTEINDIEGAGNAQALKDGVDAMREPTVQSGKVAVTDSNEDEEEESLESIQRREAGQAQVPGMRPSGQNVEVRPTEQRSIYDLSGFEQGGN